MPYTPEAGLVTTVLWTDFDGDGKMDLMMTGEWMPIRLFRNDGRQLTEETGASRLPMHLAGGIASRVETSTMTGITGIWIM
jgi:type VI protein secretion system component VasK